MSDYYLEDGTPLTEEDAHDLYDDMLDEVTPDIEIGYLSWTASRVLQEMDPIAYRCGFNDYESAQIEDGQWFEEDPTQFAECEGCNLNLREEEVYTTEPFTLCEDCYEEEEEEETNWEQYWDDFNQGKIKEEDRKDGMFRD